MHENLTTLNERGGKLDDLYEKTDQFQTDVSLMDPFNFLFVLLPIWLIQICCVRNYWKLTCSLLQQEI